VDPNNPQDPSPYALLVELYFKQKRWAESEEPARTYLKLFPVDPDAYANLGIIITQLGKGNDAVAIFRTGCEQKQLSNARACLLWTKSLIDQHHSSKEIEAAFNQAIDAVSVTSDTYTVFADWLISEGRKNDAIDLLQKGEKKLGTQSDPIPDKLKSLMSQ
jgi:tetratricopeptide (TPR) repeat protein